LKIFSLNIGKFTYQQFKVSERSIIALIAKKLFSKLKCVIFIKSLPPPLVKIVITCNLYVSTSIDHHRWVNELNLIEFADWAFLWGAYESYELLLSLHDNDLFWICGKCSFSSKISFSHNLFWIKKCRKSSTISSKASHRSSLCRLWKFLCSFITSTSSIFAIIFSLRTDRLFHLLLSFHLRLPNNINVLS
jgi:hypothetical protein